MEIRDPQEKRGRPFGKRKVRARVEAWLRDQLAEGIKPLKEIRKAQRDTKYPSRISWATVLLAKKDVGIKSIVENKEWFWELTHEAEINERIVQEIRDAQAQKIAAARPLTRQQVLESKPHDLLTDPEIEELIAIRSDDLGLMRKHYTELEDKCGQAGDDVGAEAALHVIDLIKGEQLRQREAAAIARSTPK
jgi:hypothetical protein